MTRFAKSFAFAATVAAIAGASLTLTSPAQAGGRGKEVYVQDYRFDRPMHGFSGHSGAYYCDYQRLPDRRCSVDRNGNESCKIVGWTLREMCH
jgi:hypothetical protein